MALNIKDPEAERLATEVARLASETKTAAVRTALRERRDRLMAERPRERRAEQLQQFLEYEVWPQIPKHIRGKPLTKAEREALLGYVPEGA
jgi:antitoxin VapB